MIPVGFQRKVYLICPVQRATQGEVSKLEVYVKRLEFEGILVHWPQRDTDQTPKDTAPVMDQNRRAIEWANEVHIFYSPTSRGSIFDLGIAYALGKPIKIANPEEVQRTEKRSIENFILELADKSKPYFIWEEHFSH